MRNPLCSIELFVFGSMNNRSNRPLNAWLIDGAGHILAAAHRRLDHAVTVRAFGNLNFITRIGGNAAVIEFLVTGAAGHGADAHAAFFAFVY